MAFLQNQKKPSQLKKLIILIRTKMIHKGENYSVKMQKYYFCNGILLLPTHFFLCLLETINLKEFKSPSFISWKRSLMTGNLNCLIILLQRSYGKRRFYLGKLNIYHC